MKTLLQWEWDLGGRSVKYYSRKDLFSLEESALLLCLAFHCIEKLLLQSCEGQSKREANVNLMAF